MVGYSQISNDTLRCAKNQKTNNANSAIPRIINVVIRTLHSPSKPASSGHDAPQQQVVCRKGNKPQPNSTALSSYIHLHEWRKSPRDG